MQKCKENTNILFIGKISKDGKKKFMNQNLGTDGISNSLHSMRQI